MARMTDTLSLVIGERTAVFLVPSNDIVEARQYSRIRWFDHEKSV